MYFKDFCDRTIELLNQYYKYIDSQAENIEHINPDGSVLSNPKILFPNVLLFIETQEYFAFEVMGASEKLNLFVAKESNVKKIKVKNINEYYTQANIPKEKNRSLFNFLGHNQAMFNIWIIPKKIKAEEIDKRFPQLKFKEKRGKITIIQGKSNFNSAFSFSKEFKNAYFSEVHVINSLNNNFRLKYMLYHRLNICSQNIKDYACALYTELNQSVKNGLLLGIRFVDGDEKFDLASQLSSLFLTPAIKESLLDKFLNNNPNILKSFFKTTCLLSQKELEWQSWKGESKPPNIKPDLFILRNDGYYDIVDFKLPLLNSKLTIGNINRRRLSQKPYEGVSQLAHYLDYFKFPKNSAYALKKYGIKIMNPNLWLIIGNYENYNLEAVGQALRSNQPNINIVDYDNLINTFIANK